MGENRVAEAWDDLLGGDGKEPGKEWERIVSADDGQSTKDLMGLLFRHSPSSTPMLSWLRHNGVIGQAVDANTAVLSNVADFWERSVEKASQEKGKHYYRLAITEEVENTLNLLGKEDQAGLDALKKAAQRSGVTKRALDIHSKISKWLKGLKPSEAERERIDRQGEVIRRMFFNTTSLVANKANAAILSEVGKMEDTDLLFGWHLGEILKNPKITSEAFITTLLHGLTHEDFPLLGAGFPPCDTSVFERAREKGVVFDKGVIGQIKRAVKARGRLEDRERILEFVGTLKEAGTDDELSESIIQATSKNTTSHRVLPYACGKLWLALVKDAMSIERKGQGGLVAEALKRCGSGNLGGLKRKDLVDLTRDENTDVRNEAIRLMTIAGDSEECGT